MLKKITVVAVGMSVLLLTLVACGQLALQQAAFENQKALVESNARRLAAGEAAIAACVENQCDTLNIDGMLLEDYSVINAMTHVKILMASRTSLSNLSDIAGMLQLSELHISYSNVTDLSGLANFPALSLLHAEGLSPDVDISPIGHLVNLTELAIGDLGENDDVSFVRGMTRLANLKMTWRNGEADLSILRGKRSLQNVDIKGGLPADQSALLTMPNLKAISINSPDADEAIVNELRKRGLYLVNVAIVVVC